MWNSGFPTPDKAVRNKKQTNEYLCGGLWTISKTFQGDRQGLLLYLRNVFAMRVAWGKRLYDIWTGICRNIYRRWDILFQMLNDYTVKYSLGVV